MSFRAGFAEIDITPPLGTRKIGWIREFIADTVLDPLFARVGVFESAGETIGFVQLDTLSVRWSTTNVIRERIEKHYGVPGGHVMVAATHNHAGPAVANCGEVQRDETYLIDLVEKVVGAFGSAVDAMQDAELGFGKGFEFRVAHNRRVVMRDGTVRTHGTFDDPDALFVEGPMDPEVAVLAARDQEGRLLGAIVNFTCHPTHHGSGTALSAGYPGVVASEMKAGDGACPVTLFLNGAAGNVHTADPTAGGANMSMTDAGRRLAEDVRSVMTSLHFRRAVHLASRSQTVLLPYRMLTDEEMAGTVRGAQRFVDPAIYDRTIPAVAERIRERGAQPAEVQVHFINELAVVALPGECFVQLGLQIKEKAHPRHALVVGYANGNVGYVPHKEAFPRGGYETTFAGSSKLAPEAGDILVDCAVELIRSGGRAEAR